MNSEHILMKSRYNEKYCKKEITPALVRKCKTLQIVAFGSKTRKLNLSDEDDRYLPHVANT